jgi:Holliday junction resolvase
MPSPQKAKGSAWENEVARYLSDLYGESFIRAPHSGAYIGGINTSRKSRLDESQIKTFKGDIIPGESFGAMNIECKSYKDFPFHQVVQGSCKILNEWIGQLLQVADQGDCSLLFMKFNRKGRYVAVPHGPAWNTLVSHLWYTSNNSSWLIFDFDTFWTHNKDLVRTLGSKNIKQ